MACFMSTSRDANKVGFSYSQTSTSVGPGTYQPNTNFASKRPNYTPFGSSVERDQNGMTMATPGPGSYAPPSTIARVVPASVTSSVFKSKAARFNEAANEQSLTPGPGQYSTKSEWNGRKKKKVREISNKSNTGAAITWVRVPTAPSIPASNQSYGYEEGDYGELIMQKPPKKGHSGKGMDLPGPGEYDPSDKQKSYTTSRASDFSKSKSKRIDFTKNATQTPGPGHYSNIDPNNTPAGYTHLWTHKAAPSAVFQSKVGRKTKADIKDIPGPGTYNYDSTFNRRDIPEALQFFGSTSQRFHEHRASMRTSKLVGPGSYNTASIGGFSEVKKKVQRGPASIGVGFASSSGRDHKLKDVTPGAGSYDVHLVASIETDLKKKVVSRNGVFGSTTKRFVEPAAKELEEIEETFPAIQEEPLDTNSVKKPSASFASTSTRFDMNGSQKETRPAPGDYEIQVKWSRGKHGLFHSGGTRFGLDSDNGIPGPGQYNVPVQAFSNSNDPLLDVPKKHMISGANRFNDMKEGGKKVNGAVAPGPGAYDTEYLYGNLNRPTFNVAIAHNALKNNLI